jgi:hypothetical protein
MLKLFDSQFIGHCFKSDTDRQRTIDFPTNDFHENNKRWADNLQAEAEL